MTDSNESVRLDKWLWAARFYKTRQLAIKAIKNSQISTNKASMKPSSMLKVGDVLSIKRGLYTLQVDVLGVAEKRGSATVAQTLYKETDASIAAKEKLQAQLASQPKIDIDRRKPDRRDLRSHRAFKRGE